MRFQFHVHGVYGKNRGFDLTSDYHPKSRCKWKEPTRCYFAWYIPVYIQTCVSCLFLLRYMAFSGTAEGLNILKLECVGDISLEEGFI